MTDKELAEYYKKQWLLAQDKLTKNAQQREGATVTHRASGLGMSPASARFRRCISETILRCTPSDVTASNYRRPPITMRLSVIIPCFNHGEYLAGSVKSAIQLSKHEMEILLIVQGCTDNSYEIAKALKKECTNANIEIWYVPLNLGASFARNFGVLHAKGQFYGFLDADDRYAANSIKKALEAAEKAVGDTPIVLHGRGREMSPDMKRILKDDEWAGDVTLERLSVGACFIPGCILVEHRVMWEKGLWFAEFWQRLEDYEWQIMCYGNVRFVRYDGVLLEKRQTDEARAKWPMQSMWSAELKDYARLLLQNKKEMPHV